jgi:hypothetical protein
MGLFLLQDGIHARFDSLRSKFYWEASGPKRKYHLVNWPTVCRPKAMGGLGLLNTKKMNIALLVKWIWRLYQDEETIWARLLRAKYPGAESILTASGQGDPNSGKACINSSSTSPWALNLCLEMAVVPGFGWMFGVGPHLSRTGSCRSLRSVTIRKSRSLRCSREHI